MAIPTTTTVPIATSIPTATTIPTAMTIPALMTIDNSDRHSNRNEVDNTNIDSNSNGVETTSSDKKSNGDGNFSSGGNSNSNGNFPNDCNNNDNNLTNHTIMFMYRNQFTSNYKQDEKLLRHPIDMHISPTTPSAQIKLCIYYRNNKLGQFIMNNKSSNTKGVDSRV